MNITKNRLFLRLFALFAVALMATVTLSQGSAPGNDNWGGAFVVNRYPETGSNVNATNDTGGNASVWYKWQAPSNGTIAVDTNNSTFDTTLKLFRADNLTAAFASDTDYGTDGADSALPNTVYTSIGVTAGNWYYIAVSGNGGATGTYYLRLAFTATGGTSEPQGCDGTNTLKVVTPYDGASIPLGTKVTIGGIAHTSTCNRYGDVRARLQARFNGGPLQTWIPSSGTWSSSGSSGSLYVLTDSDGNWTYSYQLPNDGYLLPGVYSVVAESTSHMKGASSTFTVTGRPGVITGSVTLNGGGLDAITVGRYASTDTGLTTVLSTATTNAEGVYTFTGIATGPHIIAPVLTGTEYIATPASKSVTMGADGLAGQNFTVALKQYTLSGTVTDAAGTGMVGVDIAVRKTDLSFFTGDDTKTGGVFSLGGLLAADYTVTPTKAGYTFDPQVRQFNGLNANQTGILFTGTPALAEGRLSGVVKVDNLPKIGIKIQLLDAATADNPEATVLKEATTISGGVYLFTDVPDGEYVLRPAVKSTQYSSVPLQRKLKVEGVGIDGLGFALTTLKYTVSGKVIKNGAGPLDGVTVTLTGASSPAPFTTGTNGQYSFSNLASGSYTITPTKAGYSFEPIKATFDELVQNETLPDFNGTLTDPKPENDPIASATPTTGLYVLGDPSNSGNVNSGFVLGTNKNATIETGEVAGSILPNVKPYRTVWYTWKAPSDGKVEFNTNQSELPASFDTTLWVYNGATFSTLVAKNDDDTVVGSTSKVVLDVTANTKYRIAVGGAGLSAPEEARFELHWAFTAAPPSFVRPDLKIKIDGAPSDTGNDVYYDVASPPAQQSAVDRASGTASYLVTLENDGNTAANITLNCVRDTSTAFLDSAVKVYNGPNTSSGDITTTIQSTGGYVATSVAANHTAQRQFLVQVTIPSGATAGSAGRFTITAKNGTVEDRVVTLTTTARPKPDLSIGFFASEDATAYAGQDYLSTSNDPLQYRDGTVIKNGTSTAKYRVRLTNTGTVSDTYSLRATAPSSPGGFAATYWLVVGGTPTTQITTDISTTGYALGTVAVGGFAEIEIRVTADATTTVNSSAVFYINAYNAGDTVVKDRVSARTWAGDTTSTPPSFKADTLVRRDGETTSVGDGLIFGVNGVGATNQMSENSVMLRPTTAVAQSNVTSSIVTVQNDGQIRERFKLSLILSGTATLGTDDLIITDVVTKVPVTDEVRAGTYLTPALAPTGSREYQVTVIAPTGAAAGTTSDVTVVAASATIGNSADDRALVRTGIGDTDLTNADGLVRREGEDNPVGDGLIFALPAGAPVDLEQQLTSGAVLVRNGAATSSNRLVAIVTVQNDGPVADRFKFNVSTSGGPDAGVHFSNADLAIVDVATGATITPSVLSGLYTTPSIASAGSRDYRFTLTVPNLDPVKGQIEIGTVGTTSVGINSVANPLAADKVFIRAIAANTTSFKADGLIKREGATMPIGNGVIYNGTTVPAEAQMIDGPMILRPTATILPSHKLTAIVTVQNDGPYTDAFKLSVTTTGHALFDNSTLTVTDMQTGLAVPGVTAGTYITPPIKSGLSRDYKFLMTAPQNIPAGVTANSTIKIASATYLGAEDRVFLRAYTADQSLATTFKADGLIRAEGATTNIGDQLIFNQGTPTVVAEDQMVTGSVATHGATINAENRVTAFVTVQNDSQVPERFRLSATTSGGTTAGGAVLFSNADLTVTDTMTGETVTGPVTGATYLTPTIPKNGTRVYRFELSAPIGVALGATGTSTIKIASATGTTGTSLEDRVFVRAYVQGISKLQYSLNEGATWADVPQSGQGNYPLTVDQGTYVDFKAIKVLPAQPWPANKPEWDGEYWFGEVGEQSWEYYEDFSVNATDLYSVGAECGNSLSANVKVTNKALLLSSDKEVICAGNLATDAHQATITAKLNQLGTPIVGALVAFTLTNSDTEYPATISSAGGYWQTGKYYVTTDANGKATVILKSGLTIGNEAVVTATYGTEQRSVTVTTEDAAAEMFISPSLIPADGVSTATLSLPVTYRGLPVVGHRITWSISQVKDDDGNIVTSPGTAYGTLLSSESYTNSSGIATVTYRAGTLSGSIEFTAEDNNILERVSSGLRRSWTTKPRKTTKATTSTTVYKHIWVVQEVGGLNFGSHAHIFVPNTPVEDGVWYGFFPADGRVNAARAGMSMEVEGKVLANDTPPTGYLTKNRYLRFPVTDAQAAAVRNAIIASKANPPKYQLNRYNCSSWAADMLGVIEDVYNSLNSASRTERIRTPKDLLDGMSLVHGLEEHAEGAAQPSWTKTP